MEKDNHHEVCNHRYFKTSLRAWTCCRCSFHSNYLYMLNGAHAEILIEKEFLHHGSPKGKAFEKTSWSPSYWWEPRPLQLKCEVESMAFTKSSSPSAQERTYYTGAITDHADKKTKENDRRPLRSNQGKFSKAKSNAVCVSRDYKCYKCGSLHMFRDCPQTCFRKLSANYVGYSKLPLHTILL